MSNNRIYEEACDRKISLKITNSQYNKLVGIRKDNSYSSIGDCIRHLIDRVPSASSPPPGEKTPKVELPPPGFSKAKPENIVDNGIKSILTVNDGYTKVVCGKRN